MQINHILVSSPQSNESRSDMYQNTVGFAGRVTFIIRKIRSRAWRDLLKLIPFRTSLHIMLFNNPRHCKMIIKRDISATSLHLCNAFLSARHQHIHRDPHLPIPLATPVPGMCADRPANPSGWGLLFWQLLRSPLSLKTKHRRANQQQNVSSWRTPQHPKEDQVAFTQRDPLAENRSILSIGIMIPFVKTMRLIRDKRHSWLLIEVCISLQEWYDSTRGIRLVYSYPLPVPVGWKDTSRSISIRTHAHSFKVRQ